MPSSRYNMRRLWGVEVHLDQIMYCKTKVWLILILMITKQRFGTNVYIKCARQEDYQSGNHKDT